MVREFLSIPVFERWLGVSQTSLPVLRVGFDGGWVTAREVVQVELSRYKAGEKLKSEEEALALLLPDEYEAVTQILADDGGSLLESSLSWFYAAGMELKSVWGCRPDPGVDLYEILETLGLDEQFSELVYFEPVGMFTRAAGGHYLKGMLDRRLDLLRPTILSSTNLTTDSSDGCA